MTISNSIQNTDSNRKINASKIVEQSLNKSLLNIIKSNLPIAAIIFNESGSLLWLSNEAISYFDIKASNGSNEYSVDTKSPKFIILKEIALKVAKDKTNKSISNNDFGNNLLKDKDKLSIQYFASLNKQNNLIYMSVEQKSTITQSKLKKQHFLKLGLTKREAEVAKMAVLGFTMANIAKKLSIKENTVHTHIKNIYQKLTISSRVELFWHVLKNIS